MKVSKQQKLLSVELCLSTKWSLFFLRSHFSTVQIRVYVKFQVKTVSHCFPCRSLNGSAHLNLSMAVVMVVIS